MRGDLLHVPESGRCHRVPLVRPSHQLSALDGCQEVLRGRVGAHERREETGAQGGCGRVLARRLESRCRETHSDDEEGDDGLDGQRFVKNQDLETRKCYEPNGYVVAAAYVQGGQERGY